MQMYHLRKGDTIVEKGVAQKVVNQPECAQNAAFVEGGEDFTMATEKTAKNRKKGEDDLSRIFNNVSTPSEACLSHLRLYLIVPEIRSNLNFVLACALDPS